MTLPRLCQGCLSFHPNGDRRPHRDAAGVVGNAHMSGFPSALLLAVPSPSRRSRAGTDRAGYLSPARRDASQFPPLGVPWGPWARVVGTYFSGP